MKKMGLPTGMQIFRNSNQAIKFCPDVLADLNFHPRVKRRL